MSISGQALSTLAELRDRMMVDGSAVARSDAAQQLGDIFSSGDLTTPEREIALAIFGKLARDVEQQVRQALAAHIASSPLVPPELARTIAADTEAVAIPFIQVSPALPEDDLLAIIGSGNTAKQIAIAGRATVSETVSEALVATHNSEVVSAVLQNEGAEISEPAYHDIMDHFAADNMVQTLLVERPSLPLRVTERLIESVSETLRERLIEKHRLSDELANALVEQAGEQTLLRDTKALPDTFDVEMLAARLHGAGKLTPTLLMRALTVGDSRFFEVGVATLASIPPANAAALIADGGRDGFRSLYEQAGLPPDMFRAFRAALDVHRDLAKAGKGEAKPDHARAILERVRREYDDGCPAELEPLLGQGAHAGGRGRFN